MTALTLHLANLVAVGLLVFGLYLPRHRRRDLVTAYLGVNIGVMAVSSILADAAIGMGLGLGLFGILSIIRLRSSELAQHEVAYYFAALALGLLGGLAPSAAGYTVALMALILLALYAGDHPRLLHGYRRQVLVLERAWIDEDALRTHLAERLNARVHGISVTKLDLVNETTTVEVRFQLPAQASRALTSEAQVLR